MVEPDSRIGRMSDWSTLRATHRRPLRVALLPCAGRGERAGGGRPKQYVEVAGRSVVHWTLLAFDELVGQGQLDGVAVVLSPGDEEFVQAVPPALRERLQVMPVGGATRAHSVWGGLQALAREGLDETDWVLVHDAARCLIEPAELLRLIVACEGDAVGGLLACPVPDTLKRADALGRVQDTVPRDHLWAAQTPQMFRLGLLRDVLGRALQAGIPVTDEAGAVEWAGQAPKLVAGPADNFKLTYPDDFRRAAEVLARRSTSIGTTP
jgi:2-C-methyl-D-erythritol 4-phosphate cytidylyltransferase